MRRVNQYRYEEQWQKPILVHYGVSLQKTDAITFLSSINLSLRACLPEIAQAGYLKVSTTNKILDYATSLHVLLLSILQAAIVKNF